MSNGRIVPNPSYNGKWQSSEPTTCSAPNAPFNPYGLYSYRVPWIVQRNPTLGLGAKALYGVLALHLGKPRPEGNRCTISVEKLAEEMGVATDTVKRWRTELVDGGWGKVVRRGRSPAEWVFTAPPGVEMAKVPPYESGGTANKPLHTNHNVAPLPAPGGISACPVVAISPARYKEENVSENSLENSSSRGAVTLPADANTARPTILTKDKSPLIPQQDSQNGMFGGFSADLIELSCGLLKAASKQSRAPAAAETLAFLHEAATFERFQAWLQALCDSGRDRLIRSYNGFLADLRRWAQQNPQTPEPKYSVWESPRFQCDQCFDDPHGIRERNGVLEWCTCERAREGMATMPELLAELQREDADLRASLDDLMRQKDTPSARKAAVASNTEIHARLKLDQVIESVQCVKCGGSITRYSDRIDSCNCQPKPRLERVGVPSVPARSGQDRS